MSEVQNKIKNGSFRVKIPTITNLSDDNKLQCTDSKYCNRKQCWNDAIQYTVHMLSQNDYAHNWQQVLPKKRTFLKHYKDEHNNDQVRISSNVFKIKINLAQLPYHLWKRQKLYKINNIVRDGIYQYFIEPTKVDNEIQELANIIHCPYNDMYKERVSELLNILKDNDIYGWVIIRANNYNYNYNKN